jgi:hypothetical protein
VSWRYILVFRYILLISKVLRFGQGAQFFPLQIKIWKYTLAEGASSYLRNLGPVIAPEGVPHLRRTSRSCPIRKLAICNTDGRELEVEILDEEVGIFEFALQKPQAINHFTYTLAIARQVKVRPRNVGGTHSPHRTHPVSVNENCMDSDLTHG